MKMCATRLLVVSCSVLIVPLLLYPCVLPSPVPSLKNPIGEGISAVMEAIDEIVADGEAAAKNAAKSAKEAVDKSEKAVEHPTVESEEKTPTTANVEEEAETKMDRTHVEDGDDSNTNTNTNDEVEAVDIEDENKEVKPASHNTASDGVASSSGDATTDDTVYDDKGTVPDRNDKGSDTKGEL